MMIYSVYEIIRIFSVEFLTLLDLIDLQSLSWTSKEGRELMMQTYPYLIKPYLQYRICKRDPWGRSYLHDIPQAGIIGIGSLPLANFSVRKFVDSMGYSNHVERILRKKHIILLLDNSGSTSTQCCTIPEGEFAGPKTVLDIAKMYLLSIATVAKESSELGIEKISLFTFNSNCTPVILNARTSEVKDSHLSKITSKGGTEFNLALDYVGSFVKEWSNTHDVHTLTITDCECMVKEDSVRSFLQSGSSLSTIMVPPGSLSTLHQIKDIAGCGTHEKLQLTIWEEATQRQWTELAAIFLTLTPIIVIDAKFSDGQETLYKIHDGCHSTDNLSVQDSVRFLHDFSLTKPTQLTVTSVGCSNRCTTKTEFVDERSSIQDFQHAAIKCVADYTDEFERMINMTRARNKNASDLQYAREHIKSILHSIKWKGYKSWMRSQDISVMSMNIVKIQSLFRGNVVRRRYQKISGMIRIGVTLGTAASAAIVIQRFYRRMELDGIGYLHDLHRFGLHNSHPVPYNNHGLPPPPPPLFMRSSNATDLFGTHPPLLTRSSNAPALIGLHNSHPDPYNNHGLPPPPPLFMRRSNAPDSWYDFDDEILPFDILDEQNDFHGDFRELAANVQRLKNLEDEMSSIDTEEKSKQKLKVIVRKLERLKSTIVSGLVCDQAYTSKLKFLNWDFIDVKGSKIVCNKGYICMNVPLLEEHQGLGQVLHAIEKLDEQVKFCKTAATNTMSHYMARREVGIPNSFLGRQMSTHPVPPLLMRQTSAAVERTSYMKALRTASNA